MSAQNSGEATLEALAMATLREALTNGTLTQRLECLPYVLPRIAPTPSPKPGKGDPSGFASLHIYTDADGEVVASDDPPPGYVVPRPPGAPG